MLASGVAPVEKVPKDTLLSRCSFCEAPTERLTIERLAFEMLLLRRSYTEALIGRLIYRGS